MEIRENYILTDTFYEQIDSVFSEAKNKKALMNIIQRYADKHSDILLTTNMSERLIFSDSDKKQLFSLLDINEEEIKRTLSKAKINPQWKKANNVFYILCLMIMHYFYEKGHKENVMYGDMMTVYLGYNIYTSAHKASFPYLPNKEVMEYTINNLSDKYLLKQGSTINFVIEHTVTEAIHGRYDVEIVRGLDEDYAEIISALTTRISSFIKKIANEFYTNNTNNKRLFHEQDVESEEEYHIADSKSYKIDRIIQATVSDLTSKGFDKNNVIRRAIAISDGVSEKKLEAMMDVILKEDYKQIPILISLLLTAFTQKSPTNSINDAHTMKFISECMQIYKSNSQDEVTRKLKDMLLYWIDLSSQKYGKNYISRGKTSLDNYRKAIFACFVFQIHESTK